MLATRCKFVILALAWATAASAITISVQKDGSGDFTLIQPAFDAAAPGDTVLIGPGEFTESTFVRPPGWGWDVETFGLISAADLTIIGAGSGLTIVGSPVYRGQNNTLSPKCFFRYISGGAVRISGLTLRGCYDGMYTTGVLYMEDCGLVDNRFGLSWFNSGSGGWIKRTRMAVVSAIMAPVSFDIGYGASGDVLLEDSYFGNGGVLRAFQGAVLKNCEFAGLNVYSGAHIVMANCVAIPGANSGVIMGMGGNALCEVRDSVLRGQYAALVVDSSGPGGRFVVNRCQLEGGVHGVLHSGRGAGSCVINGCDFVKGAGPMVECAVSDTEVIHDLTNNYWGTTDEPMIQSWIVDSSDNPNIAATVLYSPFAGQLLPTEPTTWGDLKATFR